MKRNIKWLLLLNAVIGYTIYHQVPVQADAPIFHAAKSLNDVSQSNKFSWNPLMEDIKAQSLSSQQIDEFRDTLVDSSLKDEQSKLSWQKNFDRKLQVIQTLKFNNFTENDLVKLKNALDEMENNSPNFLMTAIFQQLSLLDTDQYRWMLYQRFMSNDKPREAAQTIFNELKMANDLGLHSIKRKDHLLAIISNLKKLNTVDSPGNDPDVLGLKELETNLNNYIDTHQWIKDSEQNGADFDNQSVDDHDNDQDKTKPDHPDDSKAKPVDHDPDTETDQASADNQDTVKPQPAPQPKPLPAPKQPLPKPIQIFWPAFDQFLKGNFDRYYINDTGIHFLSDNDFAIDDCTLKAVDQLAVNQQVDWQGRRIKRMAIDDKKKCLSLRRGLRLHSSLNFSDHEVDGFIKPSFKVRILKKFQLQQPNGDVYWRYKIKIQGQSYVISGYPKYFK